MKFIAQIGRSIQWKMVFLYVLMTVIVMEVVSVYLISDIERLYMENFTESLSTNAVTLADSLRDYLDDDENSRMMRQELVKAELQFKRPAKDHILVFSADYKLLDPVADAPQVWLDSILLELGELDRDSSSYIREDQNTGERFYILGVPIRGIHTGRLGDLRTLGFVYMVAPLTEEVDQRVVEIKRILLMGTLITVGITIVLGLALARTIAKPIREVTQKAADMARGNFDQRIVVKSKDEIGQLSEMFNSLAARLKLTLSEISNEKSKMEAILTHMDNGVIALDEQGNVIHVNPKAEELLGIINRGEMDSQQILSRLNIIDPSQFLHLESVRSYEVQLQTPIERLLRVQHAPFKRDDQMAGVIMVLQDITEQDKLEQMRRDFVANVSHELKTPLTNIKIRTQTLYEYHDDYQPNVAQLIAALQAGWRILGYEENQISPLLPQGRIGLYDLTFKELQQLLDWQISQIHKKLLPVIEAEADRMDRLVKDLLQLSQIDAHQLDWENRPVVMQHVLQTVLENQQIAAEEKGLNIHTYFADDVPPVWGNPDKLEQVCVNIVTNAIKYTPAGGDILVELTLRGDYAQVVVRDTGLGIPEKDLPRIFERFFRVDKARSRELGGSGLGLSIAKQLVEAHQGEIGIKSTIGQGTEVWFTIPLYQEDETEER